MVGGLGPSGLVTLKVSVRHCPCAVADWAPAGFTWPELATRFVTTLVIWFGPLMTKLVRSSRSCKS